MQYINLCIYSKQCSCWCQFQASPGVSCFTLKTMKISQSCFYVLTLANCTLLHWYILWNSPSVNIRILSSSKSHSLVKVQICCTTVVIHIYKYIMREVIIFFRDRSWWGNGQQMMLDHYRCILYAKTHYISCLPEFVTIQANYSPVGCYFELNGCL